MKMSRPRKKHLVKRGSQERGVKRVGVERGEVEIDTKVGAVGIETRAGIGTAGIEEILKKLKLTRYLIEIFVDLLKAELYLNLQQSD